MQLKDEIMTKEEETLLLKDLCARLPYPGLKVHVVGDWFYDEKAPYDTELGHIFFDMVSGRNPNLVVKPYLRPMSSMTDDEDDELNSARMGNYGEDVVWLNAHHFYYRGLIPMGLALEAPEDMYNFNEEG